MSYALQLCCDHEGCSARWPALAEPMTFSEARVTSAREGWRTEGRHLCPAHAAGGVPCQNCGQPVPAGQRRTAYCSAPCAFAAQERKKAERYRESRTAGAVSGRSGPTTPETAARLHAVLAEYADEHEAAQEVRRRGVLGLDRKKIPQGKEVRTP